MSENAGARLDLSRPKRILFHCLYWTFLTALFFSLAEIAVRIKGYRPWDRPPSVPVERRAVRVRADPALGYRLVPGEFTIHYPDSSFSYHATHSSDGLRITHPLGAHQGGRRKKEIWIFGCSFTYGESLNDEETYPWLLQERLPDYEVVNFGVVGYGTVQSLIQFKEALAEGKRPELVVIAYASFHDERNTSLRSWRKWNRLGVLPYVRLGWDGRLKYFTEPLEYKEFPLMRYSAFMHFLEKSYDRQEGVFRRSHDASKAVIKEFADLCRANGIKLVVAGITSDRLTGEMLEHCKREGIMATSIAVDLNLPENRNLPYDQHPSARADMIYAQRLESFLLGEALDKASD